ncbi:UDP-glycosyltransferase 73B5 [Acorus gramineus]|uniref:Glycosyltransferase n=1 Tax=Acorus gramineus TaxID=55184 RepID=A0AAV9AEV8_ACOGR|nr:UDP-glycosyltransferase 73B5 [Acorus gramineus]
MSREIVVVPYHDPGHIFPCTELCNQLAARNYHVALLIPKNSSSVPHHHHPLVRTFLHSSPRPRPPPLQQPTIDPLIDYLSHASDGRDSSSIICVIVDDMMHQVIETCLKRNIPAVTIFTSSACSAALDHATWKVQMEGSLVPGEERTVPGLPDDVTITLSDMTHVHRPPSPPPGIEGLPPPPPSLMRPPRIAGTDGSAAMLFNTCDDLERPFIEYLANEKRKPVWAVGPLLPGRLWDSLDQPVQDAEIRPGRESNVGEREVLEWLDSKPRGSVIYVSFGSLRSPSEASLAELAAGLEESTRPFVWVIQPKGRPGPGPVGYYPDGLAGRAGDRGLIISGWAPQLLILSHPSTGGFISHCGWNSTVEALRFGVPILAWPIDGDQFHNAKLVTARLRCGFMIRAEPDAVTKDDVTRGIERLLGDEEARRRADSVRAVFADGFPKSSSASLDAFLESVIRNSA